MNDQPNDMHSELIEAIEKHFHRLDDGDFGTLRSSHKSHSLDSLLSADALVYTTKVHCAPRARPLLSIHERLAFVGHYGLPTNEDLQLLWDAKRPIRFLGDADPPDIMIYAWLRHQVPIEWLGVSDRFLAASGDPSIEPVKIPLSSSELASIDLVGKLVPEFREWLGPQCSSLWASGFKIELEGALVAIER